MTNFVSLLLAVGLGAASILFILSLDYDSAESYRRPAQSMGLCERDCQTQCLQHELNRAFELDLMDRSDL